MPVFLRSAARTPYGAFGGAFRKVGPEQLAALAIREAVERAGMRPEDIEALILGQALRYGRGADPGRQAALTAGLACTSWAVDQGGLSGLRALISGIHAIESKTHRQVVAAATSSASTVPYLLPAGRWGHRLGQSTALDPLLLEAPEREADHQESMALKMAELGLDKCRLAEWISESRTKALASSPQCVPAPLTAGKAPFTLATDEHLDRAPHPPEPGWPLPPLADGAAALVLSSEASGIRVAGYREAQADRPTEALIAAVLGLLGDTGLQPGALDQAEIDESLILSPLSLLKVMGGFDPQRMNPCGGAFAIGQAHGTEGLRLLVSLVHGLEQTGGRFGLAAMEGADGLGSAILLERTPA